ncbi:hypothetical protein AB0O31_33275 [Kitasatospora cineracea]|uniref:hypothetical protein n=1 Tax=Kitasatospora cineracea TaxID=88074 RepID=UPI0034122F9D
MLQDAVRGVRGVLVVAAELAEEAGRRVLDTAGELLKQGGELPPGVEQLRVLAGEAVTAGRAGVDLVAGVARGEVERVFERVGDQVVKVGVVLSFLESKLREVDEQPESGAAAAERPVAEPEPAEPAVRPAARAQGLFDAGWDAEPEVSAVPEAPDAEDVAAARRRAAAGAQAGPRRAPARKAAARKGAAAKQASAQRSVPRKAAGAAGGAGAAGAAGTPAEVAKRAAARKAAPARAESPSAPLPVKKAPAKKAPAKRGPGAKKAAPAVGGSAEGSSGRASSGGAPSSVQKAAAKKAVKAVAKKAPAKKAPAKRAAAAGKKAGAEGGGGE